MTGPGELRRVLWLSTTLCQVGGGERLVLEGARHFENRGVDTLIATFEFHERALFDGAYSPKLVVLAPETVNSTPRSVPGKMALWLRRALALARCVAGYQPQVLVAQTESSAFLLYLVTLFAPRPYGLLLFGQMFQFPEDLTKYSLIFRKHLREIRESQPGYRQIIALDPPAWSPARRAQV